MSPVYQVYVLLLACMFNGLPPLPLSRQWWTPERSEWCSVFIYGPGTRVSVVGQIRSPLFLLGGYGFYLTIALYLMGSHHSHYLGSGELRNIQSDALCSY